MPDPYHARVRDLFARTARAGTLTGDGVTSGHAGGPQHEAEIVLWLRISGGVIREARYQALACPHTIAAAEVVCERVVGEVPAQLRLDVFALAAQLAVPTEKLGRLLLVEDALRAALTAPAAGGRDVDHAG